MKAFKFTLEAVRTLRTRQEKNALEQYGKAVQVREQAVAFLWQVREELEKIFKERMSLSEGAPASALAHLEKWTGEVAARERECINNVQLASLRVETTWQALLGARQEREIVEKYLERQRERYDRSLDREEQKALDELAGRRGAPSALVPTFAWN
ncbi:MAG: flagellar export protein FliJ [Pedosphaera sp. Tous-C6FEB]|nr:MAG: flagellar export protein FliJ [Pedosphaera sp. Tous-C6FEB]